MFFFGDVRTGQGVAAVGVGDRFPLHPDLFPGDRDLHRLLFGDNVFPQPGPAGLDLFGADLELFFGPGHRVVGVRAGRVIPLAPPGASTADVRGGGLLVAGPVAAVPAPRYCW